MITIIINLRPVLLEYIYSQNSELLLLKCNFNIPINLNSKSYMKLPRYDHFTSISYDPLQYNVDARYIQLDYNSIT